MIQSSSSSLSELSTTVPLLAAAADAFFSYSFGGGVQTFWSILQPRNDDNAPRKSWMFAA